MKFYHGGHIGDVIFSLFTIMKTGCTSELYLGPHQKQLWGSKEIQALLPLCEYQHYISKASEVECRVPVDHDFTEIGKLQNHREFFEWKEGCWPGNAHLKKRYFNSYFRKTSSMAEQLYLYDEVPWLTAPDLQEISYDIVFHAPFRKINDCRPQSDWLDIFDRLAMHGYTILVVGGDDIDEWPDRPAYDKKVFDDFLQAASYIRAAKLFMGLASCCAVIAEGLDTVRFYDMAPQTTGAEPNNARGWDSTRWDINRVVKSARMVMK